MGHVKHPFNTIDNSKVIFSDPHMGNLSPLAIVLSYILVILTYIIEELRKWICVINYS